MDLNSPSSLLFNSAVAVTTCLFYHEDICGLKKSNAHNFGWVPVQNRVASHIDSLPPLPMDSRSTLLQLVQPLGDQIRKWMDKNNCVNLGWRVLRDEIVWTQHGLIDYHATAQKILQSGRVLDVISRYSLACVSGVESEVENLWNMVKDTIIPKLLVFATVPEEVRIWSAFRVKEDGFDVGTFCGQNINFPHFAFQGMINLGNVASARCFLTKSTSENPVLLRAITLQALKMRRNFNSSVVIFLLSLMKRDEMIEFLRENAEVVLVKCLEWPLQKFFLKMADTLLTSLPVTSFPTIVETVVRKIKQQDIVPESIRFATPQLYEDIFLEFWRNSPQHCRRFFVEERIVGILSNVFTPHPFPSTLHQLFSDEAVLGRLEDTFASNGSAVLCLLVNENKAKAFKTVIHKYVPSEDIIARNYNQRYEQLTQRYRDVYYGNIVLPD